MPRPPDVPQCLSSAEIRWRIQRSARLINKTRAKGRAAPLSGKTMDLLHWLLWEAPRRAGGLWPSAEAISRATGIGLRTVERARKTLAAWGLIILHPRRHRVPWPVRVGQQVSVIRIGMTTSHAVTFPDFVRTFPAQFRPRQISGEGEIPRFSRDKGGRFLPAPVRDRFELLRKQGAPAESGAPTLPADAAALAQRRVLLAAEEQKRRNREAARARRIL